MFVENALTACHPAFTAVMLIDPGLLIEVTHIWRCKLDRALSNSISHSTVIDDDLENGGHRNIAHPDSTHFHCRNGIGWIAGKLERVGRDPGFFDQSVDGGYRVGQGLFGQICQREDRAPEEFLRFFNGGNPGL